MKKKLMKCLLFISSYFPLYIFLLVLNFDQYNSYEKNTDYNIFDKHFNMYSGLFN